MIDDEIKLEFQRASMQVTDDIIEDIYIYHRKLLSTVHTLIEIL